MSSALEVANEDVFLEYKSIFNDFKNWELSNLKSNNVEKVQQLRKHFKEGSEKLRCKDSDTATVINVNQQLS
jgi:hypothetical protein